MRLDILTCNGLCGNRGVVMRVVARVEKVVVQCSVEPVIQKFHGTHVKEQDQN